MRAPASTYRLQITEDFDLLEAAKTLRYLQALGVDWVYLSPVLGAGTGSEHGYDVTSHAAVDPSRGRGAGLAALSTEAKRLGMGVLVDIVPNHVGVARPWENEWWWHVLTHGQDSQYASAFDIDWDFGGGKVRIPVVADEDLSPDGSISNLRLLGGELHYHDQRFPLAPGTADGPVLDPNAVLSRQSYALTSWREADRGLNYRRFFAVNTLVAIRVEDPQWFEASHEEIRRWFDEGLVDGLRIDHPDGLRDPAGYLERLSELTAGAYVVIEKILEPGEELPPRWATAGTTGYDTMALVDRVLTDPAGEAGLTALEDELRGAPVDWDQLTHDTKRAVADEILGSETARIAREALLVLGEEADTPELVDAVAEVLACFPVYRSYLPDGRDHLVTALKAAVRHRPDLAGTIEALTPVLTDGATAAAARFQQTSGMVMAKGVEDCAFYRWSRLTSLNEVGADPSRFSVSVADFHEAMRRRQDQWPTALSASSTHDTKRGEDVRARIAVLAELPELWSQALHRLLELVPVPDPGCANLFWQAVIGSWPASRERLSAYLEKAMREAGEHTSWTEVNVEYEQAMQACVDAAFDSPEVREVLDEVLAAVVDPGWSNALASKLITLTMPGVPDIYQGSELWEMSLVDPDNRRPVDFAHREELLATAADAVLVGGIDDPGHVKQRLVREALTLRRDQPQAFSGYEPVAVSGPAAEHLLAYDRGGVVVLATRLPVGLAARGGWGDTTVELPLGRYRNVADGRVVEATGEPVQVAKVLGQAPVAMLVGLPEFMRSRTPFDVWAPERESVTLHLRPAGEVETELRQVPMRRRPGGWWAPAEEPERVDLDYGYTVDNDPTLLPDPRSRRQPYGVHGISRTHYPDRYTWGDGGWVGKPLSGSVLYELHVGTFTPEGTLDAAAAKLGHLQSIGVDFVELMPVNAMNGVHNWGYDGVLWYAVHEPYGGPEAYQRFVDACHAVGIGVIQDVVYNHFGASGNYLPRFGPYLAEAETTWGQVVNLDGRLSAETRRYVIDNALMWFQEMHVDGLRLDAVHALVDESETHLLEELSAEVAELAAHQKRPLVLIAESDQNDARLVLPREAGGMGIDAQWSDDFHHALHVALTGETGGYYADFAPLGSLAKVLTKGFFHDGTWSSFRGRDHGVPIDPERFPGWRFVVSNQNHDQVGNRAQGDRLAASLDTDQLALAAMLTLTSPFTPMLFMGEEWGASTPFQFFTSHPEPDLAQAVSEGRVREFERMDWGDNEVPDPQDLATYERSRLCWDEVAQGEHGRVLGMYRSLARLRREIPELSSPHLRHVRAECDEAARWLVVHRGDIVVVANFSDQPVTVPMGHIPYRVAWQTPGYGVWLDWESVKLQPHCGAVLVPEGR
ncbi:MAG: malto-oligosyltrehalose synthase [Actinomycetia bacterium]|nr:malto-oligosyltrehalose synthase [Actinomycetes bacterium]